MPERHRRFTETPRVLNRIMDVDWLGRVQRYRTHCVTSPSSKRGGGTIVNTRAPYQGTMDLSFIGYAMAKAAVMGMDARRCH